MVPLLKSIRLVRPLRKVVVETPKAPRVFTDEEVELAKKESYQRGCADTAAMTEQHLMEQRDEVIHLQQKTFAGLIAHHHAIVEQLRAILPELALESARRILANTELDRSLVVRLVEELLLEIVDSRQAIEVSLSAHDLKLIEGNEADFREKYPAIEFRLDPEMQPGDCVARSRHGSIDGRLNTKLKAVGQAFR